MCASSPSPSPSRKPIVGHNFGHFLIYYSKFAKDHFFSTVRYFCVFVINMKIDFKELNIISASCTWQIDNLSTQEWGPRTGIKLAEIFF